MKKVFNIIKAICLSLGFIGMLCMGGIDDSLSFFDWVISLLIVATITFGLWFIAFIIEDGLSKETETEPKENK